MKKAMNKAAECYEQTMGCTIQETLGGFGIVALGIFVLWLLAKMGGVA